MPCTKYYRSIIPHDLLTIIGNYAGDTNYKLVFTYSKKRGFISTIRLEPRRKGYYKPTILKSHSWRPLRLGHFSLLHDIMKTTPFLHIPIFKESMLQIRKLLVEIHDYTLHPKLYEI